MNTFKLNKTDGFYYAPPIGPTEELNYTLDMVRDLDGDTIASVTDHVKQKAGSDRFELMALPGAAEPSPVSPTQSASYQLINRTMRQLFPDVLVAPGLMVAGTDSIHYGAISDHVFKFSPIRANAEDLKRFHGTNERLSVQNYAEAIRFYHRLIPQVAKGAQ